MCFAATASRCSSSAPASRARGENGFPGSKMHGRSNSALQSAAVRQLADELTATETVFPGPDLRLIFALPDPVLFPGSGGLSLLIPHPAAKFFWCLPYHSR